MTIAFIFPGQGSQSVGMGKTLADNFAAARNVFDAVDEALGEKLTAVMWEGPADRLTLTENAQAAQAQVCQAANDNGGGQVVVSGDRAAVERAVEIAKGKGARRAMLLPVSAPFHCALMQPAADVMADALAKIAIKPPVLPLVA